MALMTVGEVLASSAFLLVYLSINKYLAVSEK